MTFKSALVAFLIVVTLALSLGGCITITSPEASAPPAPAVTPAVTPPPAPINPAWTPPPTTNQTEALPSIADAVALVKPSVVAINTQVVSYDFFNRPFTQEGAGSGWIIDSDGLIVTNNHVVEGARTITVTTDDGSSYTANIDAAATDPLNDLAILKIDAHDLPALKRGDTSRLRVGDWVIAIGNALGQGIRATEGIVSRKDVSLPVSQGQTLYDLIETSAAINPGNSGGPLVNLAGEVIGITSAKVADIGVEGMGYAISINTATPIIQELVNKGYVVRPWLGVQLYTVDQTAVRQLGLKVNKGVLLVQVVANSPAQQAGLKEGDVIVSFGGKDVTNVQELTRILHTSEVGQPLEIKYWRGDTTSTAQVIPAASPRP
ncbi:MAG TPA: trypsin-like peptidase domain-containing protein [Dehalococcoidales bacterium]|nr:trypsin-like peptidase domain-containing protein [Dehalococcoidales bacterium]